MKFFTTLGLCFTLVFRLVLAQNLSSLSEPFSLSLLNTSEFITKVKSVLNAQDIDINLPGINFPVPQEMPIAVGINNRLTVDLAKIKNSLTAQLTVDGYMLVGGVSFARVINPGILLLSGDAQDAAPGFSLSGGHLKYNGSDNWHVSVNGTELALNVPNAPIVGDVKLNIPLSLQAVGSNGKSLVDFPSLNVDSTASLGDTSNYEKRDNVVSESNVTRIQGAAAVSNYPPVAV